MKLNKLKYLALALGLGIFITAIPATAHADAREQGVDWAIYQGKYGKFGYSADKFVFSQIGGFNGRGNYTQSTYNTQVQSALAQGKRAHTYIWYQVGGSTYNADLTLNYLLPKVQTPKGSIVALDYEDGASANKQANTNAVLRGMDRVKQAGYTPVLYTGTYYAKAHLNYNQILTKYPNSFWIASYIDYQVRRTPNYNYFPSFPGIAIWQFTSTYQAGGLDGNVDLTGITKVGYTANSQPKSVTPAVVKAEVAKATPKADIKAGDSIKVNQGAQRWSNGVAIPSFVKGSTYKVIQVSGNKVLLAGVYSWINKSDIAVVALNGSVSPSKSLKSPRLVEDGILGKRFVTALQRRLGVYPDGILGKNTIKALQHKLNNGGF